MKQLTTAPFHPASETEQQLLALFHLCTQTEHSSNAPFLVLSRFVAVFLRYRARRERNGAVIRCLRAGQRSSEVLL